MSAVQLWLTMLQMHFKPITIVNISCYFCICNDVPALVQALLVVVHGTRPQYNYKYNPSALCKCLTMSQNVSPLSSL